MKISLIVKQQKRINSLENKIETLESTLKDKLYKEFMKKLDEPFEIERLKKENKRLKQKIKQMKESENIGKKG